MRGVTHTPCGLQSNESDASGVTAELSLQPLRFKQSQPCAVERSGANPEEMSVLLDLDRFHTSLARKEQIARRKGETRLAGMAIQPDPALARSHSLH